ncbi:MAG TPA: hypothetical protein VHG91_05260 [Longimicrobium sp.]|nr:hypothetical protein [Longimicrobium sp.]
MIEEYVRELTDEERRWLEEAARPSPADRPPPRPSRFAILPAVALAVGAAVFAVLALAAAFVGFGGGREPALAGIFGVVALVWVYRLSTAERTHVPTREWWREHDARNRAEHAAALADGHAVVKRVRAVAVVEIEPIEDEGTGWIYDLGDGRVLFLKGQDYEPPDEDDAWPNTDFEIVRTRATGRWLDLRCHGAPLRPLRVVRSEELDAQAAWDEREEVLDLGLEDAVKTILRAR